VVPPTSAARFKKLLGTFLVPLLRQLCAVILPRVFMWASPGEQPSDHHIDVMLQRLLNDPCRGADGNSQQPVVCAHQEADYCTSRRKPTWKLCWVCDECCKSSREAQRGVLQQRVTELAGTLKLFKKGLQFAHWFKWTSHTSNILLVINWREAKPCFHIMMQHPSAMWPGRTVLLCKDGQQYARAMEWASTMPNAINVYEETDIPPAAFSGFLHQCFGRNSEFDANPWNPAWKYPSCHPGSASDMLCIAGGQGDNLEESITLGTRSSGSAISSSGDSADSLTSIIAKFTKPCKPHGPLNAAILLSFPTCSWVNLSVELSQSAGISNGILAKAAPFGVIIKV